ncbi:MAG: hypothetical protein ACK41E_06670 [Deinococcales bacterium]
MLRGKTDIQVGIAGATRLAAAIGQEPVLLENVNHVLKTATLEPVSQKVAYADPKLPIALSVLESPIEHHERSF